jgi:hypothetical protein
MASIGAQGIRNEKLNPQRRVHNTTPSTIERPGTCKSRCTHPRLPCPFEYGWSKIFLAKAPFGMVPNIHRESEMFQFQHRDVSMMNQNHFVKLFD